MSTIMHKLSCPQSRFLGILRDIPSQPFKLAFMPYEVIEGILLPESSLKPQRFVELQACIMFP